MEQKVLDAAEKGIVSQRVSDVEMVATIREVYKWPYTPDSKKGYFLGSHWTFGVIAALRSVEAAQGVYNSWQQHT